MQHVDDRIAIFKTGQAEGLSDHQIMQQIEDYATKDYHLLVCEVSGETVGFVSIHWFLYLTVIMLEKH